MPPEWGDCARPESQDAYVQARKTLSSVSEYLRGISVGGDHDLMNRLQHAFLAIDHLRRLTYRCEGFDRLEATADDALLVDYVSAVRQEIDTVLSALDNPIRKETQLATKSQFKEFANRSDADRQHFSELVAQGAVGPATAITRLDSLRWLRRISYHLWRIVRHLRHVQFESSASQSAVPDTKSESPSALP